MSVESTERIAGYHFTIRVSGHTIQADVPQKLGGGDNAPDPHDYMVSALAGCTVITMQMYANLKGIPLESADVRIRITEEGKDGNRIERDIQLKGELTEEQRQRLLQIAERCPIHNFLQRGATIQSQLVAEHAAT